MAILPIIEEPDPFLHKVAKPVERVDDEIRKLVDDMAETMYAAPGVGLAAPQVGRSIRLLVADWNNNDDDLPSEPVAIINPKLVAGEGEIAIEEGCLSVPEFTLEVPRYQRIVIECLNRDGEEVRMDLDDFAAIVVQHEMDHLDGITLLKRVSALRRKIYVKKRRKAAERDPESQPRL